MSSRLKTIQTNTYLKKIFLILVAIVNLGFLVGCGSLTNKKGITEGIIEYAISYPGMEKGDVFAAMMFPSKMEFKFKGGKTLSELGTGTIFKTSIITDAASRNGFQLLKVVNKKYILKLDSIGIKENALKVFPEIKITPTSEVKEIAGYECKKAIVEVSPGKKFDVFYCPEIGPKNANWFNPFKGLDGMLMEYNYKDFNIEMRFTAVKVLGDPVDDSQFMEPKGYEPITKEKMSEIFESF